MFWVLFSNTIEDHKVILSSRPQKALLFTVGLSSFTEELVQSVKLEVILMSVTNKGFCGFTS